MAASVSERTIPEGEDSQIWWPDGKDKLWISLSEVDQDLTNKEIRFGTVDTPVPLSRNLTFLLIPHHFPPDFINI